MDWLNQLACDSDSDLLAIVDLFKIVVAREDMGLGIRKMIVVWIIDQMLHRYKGQRLRKTNRITHVVGSGIFKRGVSPDTLCTYFSPVLQPILLVELKMSTFANVKTEVNRLHFEYSRLVPQDNLSELEAAHLKILSAIFGKWEPPHSTDEAYTLGTYVYTAIYYDAYDTLKARFLSVRENA
jgi:hypothetical protein